MTLLSKLKKAIKGTAKKSVKPVKPAKSKSMKSDSARSKPVRSKSVNSKSVNSKLAKSTKAVKIVKTKPGNAKQKMKQSMKRISQGQKPKMMTKTTKNTKSYAGKKIDAKSAKPAKVKQNANKNDAPKIAIASIVAAQEEKKTVKYPVLQGLFLPVS